MDTDSQSEDAFAGDDGAEELDQYPEYTMPESDEESEKDEDEEELERLVFGDSTGFKQELKNWNAAQEVVDTEDGTLADIGDADLFFLDSAADKTLAPTELHDGAIVTKATEPGVWEDSDDDRMMLSLMSVPRLRKLRRFEGEDVISGREYQRRLQEQFELLNPKPKWLTWAESRNQRRKRRRGVDSEGEDSSDEDGESEAEFSTQPLAKLLRSNKSFTRDAERTSSKRPKLRPETIGIERMKDIQPTQPSAITSISIHPTMPLILSSGPSSMLYLHRLQPHPVPPDPANPLITSVHLKNTPLTTSAFSAPSNNISSENEQTKIYLSSRRRYFHIWDLPTGQIKKTTRTIGHSSSQRSYETLKPSPCGRYIGLLGTSKKASAGVINILDANTTFWLAQAVVESSKGVADFQWWADGEGITIAGRSGEIAEWSMSERRILRRWQDEGAVGVTTIALGGLISGSQSSKKSKTKRAEGSYIGPDRYVSVGSTSGIVNLYNRSQLFSPSASSSSSTASTVATNLEKTYVAEPLKTFDQLTTPISHLGFSPCGQLMSMSSRWKRDALRLIHVPTCSVYKNWPTQKTPLGRISAVALGEYEIDGQGTVVAGEKRIVLAVGNEKGALRCWEISA